MPKILRVRAPQDEKEESRYTNWQGVGTGQRIGFSMQG